MKSHVEKLVEKWTTEYESAYGPIRQWHAGRPVPDVRMRLLAELKAALLLDEADKVGR